MANLIQILGAIAVTTGASLIYLPAGIIVGGVFLFLIGLALERD